MKNLSIRVFVSLVLFLFTAVDIFAQCAMCRGSVESSIGNGKNTVAFGLNTGIMYLFAIPYIIVAVLVYLWFKNSRAERAKREMVRADY